MKTSKVVLMLVAALLLTGTVATAFAAPSMGWPNNKGEVCLQVLKDDTVVGTVHMYVTKMGDGHYLVLGRSTEATEVVPFIGAAELVENKTMVRMHFTASGVMPPLGEDEGDVHGTLATMMLDRATLVGTVHGLDMNFDFRTRVFGGEYGTGDILPCP